MQMAGLLVKLRMHREKACDLGPDLHTSSSEIYAGSGVCRMKSSSLNICILSEIITKLLFKIPSMCSQL